MKMPFGKKIISFFVRGHRIAGRNPYNDWLIAVGTFSILLILSAALCGTLFYQIKNGSIFKETVPSPVVVQTPSDALNQKILTLYREKEALFDNLKQTKLDLVDPSL